MDRRARGALGRFRLSRVPPTSMSWGAIVMGAMAGLGLALAVFLILAASGVVSGTGEQAILVFVQFTALFVAGFVAGRLSRGAPPLDGGMAGLLVYLITVAISVAGGASLGLLTLVFLGVTAAVLGSAGGVLAQFVQHD